MTRRHGMLLGALLALAAVSCSTIYEFEDVNVGGDDSGRAPRARSNGQWLRSVYADLIGRTPENYDFLVTDAAGTELARFPIDEQQLLLGLLDGVGDPTPLRALIAAGLVHSAEVSIPDKDEVDDPEAWIAEQFRRFLGREPGPYELRAFADEWRADDAVGPHTVIRALIGSREYQSF